MDAQLLRAPMWLLALAFAATAVRADAPVSLAPRAEIGLLTRVEVELEVGGDLKVRDQAEAKPDQQDPGPLKTVPMRVEGKLEYLERVLTLDQQSFPVQTLRYYNTARATVRVDQANEQPELADNRRLILVDATSPRPLVTSPTGPLTRQDLDVVDIVGNTAVLQMLLPAEPVEAGGTWGQSAAAMQRLLGLDSIAACEIQSVLDETNEHFAKVRLAGTVDGAVDGTATSLEIKGVYLFDRREGRIAQLNLAMKENRSLGPVSPGVEAVAKLRIKITGQPEAKQLADEVLGSLPEQPVSELKLSDPRIGLRTLYDRAWYITGDRRDQLTLRRIDASGLTAQCTLTRLPPLSPGAHTGLEEFVREIQLALGKNFGQLVASQQWTNSQGELCLGVEVAGKVADVPVAWHYYLIAPPKSGHRISMVVTTEQETLKRLAKADRALVDALKLIAPESAEVARTEAAKTK